MPPARKSPAPGRRARLIAPRLIAHDVNNLLTAISGGAELILARGGDPATIEDAREIAAAAARAASLVGRLLAPGGGARPEPRAIALGPAIGALAPLLGRLLGSRIDLVLALEDPGPMVRIDPAELDRVLVNLAVNAQKPMEAGGEFRLSTGEATLARARGAVPPGRYATIEAADTGCGIAPALLPRIFAPGFTTRAGEGGHGLGLAAAHEIVREAGGFIRVESEPGRGTRFCIHLPLLEPPGDQAGAAATPGRTALVVEDEPAVGRVAALALRKQGWVVHLAESAESVLANLGRLARPDVLVSDLALPGLDGPALVRRLRERWPGLPAILASGYVDEAARLGLAAEQIIFLAKPYRLASLVSAVSAAAGAIAAATS